MIAGTRDGRAFVYSDGAFNALPTPDGFTTRAMDINSQGWVLGELRPLLAPSSAYNCSGGGRPSRSRHGLSAQ